MHAIDCLIFCGSYSKSASLQKARNGAPAQPPWSANVNLPLDSGHILTHDEQLAQQLKMAQEQAEVLQRQYTQNNPKKKTYAIQKHYKPTAVWMDTYDGPEGTKAAQKQVNLSAQGGAGYNIISGGDSIGSRVRTPRVSTGRISTGRISTGRLPSARPASGAVSRSVHSAHVHSYNCYRHFLLYFLFFLLPFFSLLSQIFPARILLAS